MRKVIKWLWWSPAVLVCAGAALRYWPARVPQGCIPYSSSDDGLSLGANYVHLWASPPDVR